MPEFGQPQIHIYEEPHGPKFEGQFANEPPQNPKRLKVVSYNINDGIEVAQAISELGMYNPLRGSDFFLLQEMDEVGTEQIARKLQVNYIYYPSSMPARIERNFGNAILSRWPLSSRKSSPYPTSTRPISSYVSPRALQPFCPIEKSLCIPFIRKRTRC